MSRRRFIADLVTGDRAALLGAHAFHLSRVLRARVGQEFEITVNGGVRRGAVIRVGDERVDFELGDEISASPLLSIILYLSIVRFERMEWAIEKCAELGAARLIPLIAARTDAHLAAAAVKRVERWRRLAMQAAEQSRAAAPAEIASPLRLNRELLSVEGARIVLAERGQSIPLRDALPKRKNDAGAQALPAVTLALGPEGGWTDGELKLFSESNWISASLGRNILRSETAAIAALAVIMALGGE
jgi:16S rRNA (uracil1498-N3)-methyltransferase